MIKVSYTLLFFFLFAVGANAQEKWDLQKCIETAWQNSIDVGAAQTAADLAKIELRISKLSRLPSLNANVNYNANYGRSIDPVTNSFESQNFSSNGFSVSGGVVVFNAGRIHNTIKGAQASSLASQQDVETARNNIALSVVNTYLQVLLAEENKDIAQERLNLAQERLSNTTRLVEIGSRPQAELYSVQAQVATENQNLVTATNNLDLSLMNLKLLMLVEPDKELQIVSPEIGSVDQYIQSVNFESVYNSAIQVLPDVSAAQNRLEAADYNIKVAQAAYYPTLSVGVGAGTNWSSLAREFTATGVELQQQPGVFIDDQAVKFEVLQAQFDVQDQPYFDQLNTNLNYGFNVSANIPIFSNGQNKGGVQRANLNKIQSQLDVQRAEQNVRNNVLTAVTNLRAAVAQYEASLQNHEALQLAYSNAQKQYEVGAINGLNLNTALNDYRQVQSQLLTAKYDLIFRSLLVDFYRGIPLQL